METTKKSNFNQVFWLGVGQVFTFLATFLSGVILSRYFTKADYGTYRQVLFVYNILFSVFSAGLASAYSFFIPRLNDAQAKTIVSKINKILVLFGVVLSSILFWGSGFISGIMQNKELDEALQLFCLTPLFTLPALGVESLYTAIRNTKIIAIYQLFGKMLVFFCSVVPVVIFHLGYKEAIIGWTAASFVTFVFAFVLKWAPYKTVKQVSIEGVYLKVVNYSFPLMAAAIVGLMLNSATEIFISRYWGSAYFADYSNGYIGLPFVVMVAGPIKSLLQPLFSKAEHDGNFDEALSVYEDGVKQCMSLLLPLIFFSFLFAPDIITFVYGQHYISSVPYFRLSLLKDIATILPYISILLAFGKSNVYFVIHLLATIFLWLLDVCLVFVCNAPVYYALAYTIVGFLIPIVMLFYIRYQFNLKILSRSLFAHIFKVSVHTVSLLVLIYMLFNNVSDEWLSIYRLILMFSIFMVLLMATGKLIHLDYYMNILHKLKKK